MVEDYLLQIDGYTLVRQYRKIGGSGVALYVQNTLKVKILEKPDPTKVIATNLNISCVRYNGATPPLYFLLLYISHLMSASMLTTLMSTCDPMEKSFATR